MKKLIKIILSVFITMIILYFLFSKVEISTLWEALSSLPIKLIIGGFFIYLLVYIIRTLRFHVLIRGMLSIKNLFSIVCIHNLFTQMIPARLGELSYIYMLKKRKVPLKINLSSLTIARIIDFIMLSILFFFGIYSTPLIKQNFYLLFIIILLLFILITIFLLITVFRPEKVIILIKPFKKRIKHNFFLSLINKLEETLYEFKILKSKKSVSLILLSSLALWLSMYAFGYVFLIFLFPDLTLSNIALVVSLPGFISILPIHGIGGYGTTEVGFMFPLLLFNISVSDAIIAGFIVHSVQVVFLIIFGFFGLLYFKRSCN